MTTNQLAQKAQQSGVAVSPVATIRGLLEKSKAQIAAALPKHMTPDRMLRVVMTSIQRTPALLDCDVTTLIGAVIQSAQLGLEPDGVLGHAYLVPFYNNKKGRKECQFIPGYKGLIDLARRSGQVINITSHVVYEDDSFSYEYGLEEKLEHKPARGNRGKPVAVYAVARFKDGGYHFEVLSVEDVEKTRKVSKAGQSGPWESNWDEMARKTAIRRLAKYLPLSVEFARAASLDEAADRGDQSDILRHEIEIPAEDAPAKRTLESALADRQPLPPAEDAAPAEPTQAGPVAFEDVLAQIDSFGVQNGTMVAYTVRALGSNKPRDQWSFDDAKKVLASIRRAKGNGNGKEAAQ